MSSFKFGLFIFFGGWIVLDEGSGAFFENRLQQHFWVSVSWRFPLGFSGEYNFEIDIDSESFLRLLLLLLLWCCLSVNGL